MALRALLASPSLRSGSLLRRSSCHADSMRCQSFAPGRPLYPLPCGPALYECPCNLSRLGLSLRHRSAAWLQRRPSRSAGPVCSRTAQGQSLADSSASDATAYRARHFLGRYRPAGFRTPPGRPQRVRASLSEPSTAARRQALPSPARASDRPSRKDWAHLVSCLRCRFRGLLCAPSV